MGRKERRQTREKYLTIVRLFVRTNTLTNEQGQVFEQMFHKCGQLKEFQEVSQAMRTVSLGFRICSDRNAKLRRDDDPLGVDDLLDDLSW